MKRYGARAVPTGISFTATPELEGAYDDGIVMMRQEIERAEFAIYEEPQTKKRKREQPRSWMG